MPIIFVTGTDTECGKTHVSCALLAGLNGHGQSAAGYKPVAAGCEMTADGWRNEDGLLLQQYSVPGLAYEAINPMALHPPIAPHIAAAEAGLVLDLPRLRQGAQALQKQAQWVVVEGAGGFLVPLGEGVSFADLVEQAAWPCILVVGMRLGCINHALLSVEAIQRRSRLLGWVANVLPPEQVRLEENIDSLKARIDAPCLGVVRSDQPGLAAAELDLELLISQIQGNL